MASLSANTALNGICPYFTMFPLEFPLRVLKGRTRHTEAVLDPFCGRGTTNFAARLLGLRSLGIDSSPVAAAITAAKLVEADPTNVLSEARKILTGSQATDVPAGEFWERAYHPDVLFELCQFRTALSKSCSSDVRIALRAIILGALHGPQQKKFQSYFSNQSPRTYAPKPAYATRYWRERHSIPFRVDVLDIIERRAKRYYQFATERGGEVRLADSRDPHSFLPRTNKQLFSWVITSPPYYGMRTYLPDQWLRNWFLGGPDRVDYKIENQVAHSSPEDFARDLRQVWNNAAEVCLPNATMVIRFGGIADRLADPLDLAKMSIRESAWRLRTVKGAGSAHRGKRQADAFLRKRSKPVLEFDLWARLA